MNIGNTLSVISFVVLGYFLYMNKDKKNNTYNKKYGTARG